MLPHPGLAHETVHTLQDQRELLDQEEVLERLLVSYRILYPLRAVSSFSVTVAICIETKLMKILWTTRLFGKLAHFSTIVLYM